MLNVLNSKREFHLKLLQLLMVLLILMNKILPKIIVFHKGLIKACLSAELTA